MNMKEAVTSAVFKKYATIEGRASRSEFWWFVLFTVLASNLIQLLDTALGWQFGESDALGNQPGVLFLLFNLGIWLLQFVYQQGVYMTSTEAVGGSLFRSL